MKTVSENFDNKLKSQSATLCHCWKVELLDGAILGFTNHDTDLTVAGTTYVSNPSLNTPVIEHTLGFNVDSVDALGVIDDDLITDEDLRSGRYQDAKITLFAVDWENLSDQIFLMQGHVATIRESGEQFEFEIRQITDAFENKQGRFFSHMCDARLGDQRCKIDLSFDVYSAQGTVIDIISNNKLVVTNLDDYEPGWFTNGTLEIELLHGTQPPVTIARHKVVNGQAELSLWVPLAILPEIGSTIRVKAGCNKLFSTCGSKFDNQLNFQGFPHIPGKQYGIS